jgi:ribosomal protein L30E
MKRAVPQLPIPADVVRCVRSPQGRLVADFYRVLPCDRPLWLGMRPDVLQRMIGSEIASVWFGEPTIVDERFIEQCKTMSRQAVLTTLAMAHKSGLCVLGLESVLIELGEETLRLVIIATDAGKSDQKKLTGNRFYAPLCVHFGTRAQLGQVLGRKGQVFIGVRHGVMAEKLAGFLRCSTGFHNAISL